MGRLDGRLASITGAGAGSDRGSSCNVPDPAAEAEASSELPEEKPA